MSARSFWNLVAYTSFLLVAMSIRAAGPNGNPLALNQPFAGTFKNDRLTVKLEYDETLPVPSYKGTIEQGSATFPVRASAKDGKLDGTFTDKDNNTFSFTAALEDNTLTLSTGGASYRLAKQRPALNPLAQPQNPLAQPDNTAPAPANPLAGPPSVPPAVVTPAAPANQPRTAGIAINISMGGDGSITISEVVPNGPAARGGVRAGDKIISIDDRPVRNVGDLANLLPGVAGTTMKLRVQRGNQALEFNLTREPPRNAGVGMHITVTGDGAIVVDELIPNAPAARGGVRVGDRLIAVDDRPLSIQNLADMLPGASGSTMRLRLQRGNQMLEFNLTREVVRPPTNQPAGDSRGPTGAAPADAAPAKDQEIKLVQYTIQDPRLNMPAYAFAAPADWTRQGEVIWTGHIAPAAITVLRIANPKGPEEFMLYPAISFTTGNPQQAFGTPNHPQLDPANSIRQIIIPRCRAEARNGKELGYQDMPKLAQQFNQQALEQGLRIPQIQAGRLLVEYILDDRPMVEMFYCVTAASPGANGTLWSIATAFSYRSSKEKFYGEAPLFNWMAVCLKENPQWTAARLQRVRDMVNRAYPITPPTASNSGPSILDVSRSMARDQDRFLSHIDKINTSRLNSTDNWSSAFRNTSTLTDPNTGEKFYNMPSTFQRTFRTDSGVIYGTDDPTYDPWVNGKIRATELK